MKSQTMSVLSNPTIISYSLIACSTLILGYYTFHDSQAFKLSEESEGSKLSFGSPEKTENAPLTPASFFGSPKEEYKTENAPPTSSSFFGGPKEEDKTENAPLSNNLFGAPKEENVPASDNLFDSPKEENVAAPAVLPPAPPTTNLFGSPQNQTDKPMGTGGKKSRNRNKKNAKKVNKSKKHHKL